MQLAVPQSNRPAIALAFCLFLAYLLPYRVAPLPNFYSDFLASLGILAAFAFLIVAGNRTCRVPMTAAIPLFLAGVILVQTAAGMMNHLSDAAIPLAYLVLAAISMVLGATLAAGGGAAALCNSLAVALVLAGLLSVSMAALQFARAEIPFYPFVMLMERSAVPLRPHANIAQPNQLALLLCIALAALWWLFQARRVGPRIAATAAIGLLWGLTLTQSRIGWVIVPLLAGSMALLTRREGFRVIPVWFFLGCLLAYLLMGWFGLPWMSELVATPTASLSDRFIAGGAGRGALFQQALYFSLERPWFGIGWAQFGPQQLMAAAEFGVGPYARHAHNIFLNFAAEIGWPLTVVLHLMAAGWLFIAGRRTYQSANANSAFAILVFIAVAVHSMTEYPLWYAYILIPTSILIGMVHYECFKTKERSVPRAVPTILVALFLVSALGLAEDYRRLVAGYFAQEMASISVDFDREALRKPAITVFPHEYEFFHLLNAPLDDRMTDEQLAELERVSRRYGGTIVWMRMSQIYAVNQRTDDAVRAMRTIYALHPKKYPFHYNQWRQAPAQYQEVFRRLPTPVRPDDIDVPKR